MKSRRVVMATGLGVFALIIVSTATAEMRPGSFGLTPFFGGYLFEGAQNLKHRPTYGLGLGYALDEHWGAEAVFNYVDTESEVGAGDVNAYLYRLDCIYHFIPFQRLVPYLAAGIGGITLDPDRADTDADVLVNYGAGLKYFLNETIALRGDVRHIIAFHDTEHNLAYTVGLTFLLGGQKKEAPAPRDSDSDGVFDDADRCPDTPAGVSVDSFGCPLDSDGDGVPDYADECPGTPMGVKVNDKGCPLDSDGDGVPDHLDQCPRTPKGATVNEVGCWVCKGVEFGFNEWDIKPQYYPNLNEAVDCMQQHPDVKVQIEGHTDNIGTKEYNEMLSERRAQAVMDYFMQKGISKERLSAVGYGLSRPVASNETEEGRAKNRRVQLTPIY